VVVVFRSEYFYVYDDLDSLGCLDVRNFIP